MQIPNPKNNSPETMFFKGTKLSKWSKHIAKRAKSENIQSMHRLPKQTNPESKSDLRNLEAVSSLRTKRYKRAKHDAKVPIEDKYISKSKKCSPWEPSEPNTSLKVQLKPICRQIQAVLSVRTKRTKHVWPPNPSQRKLNEVH